VNERTETYAQPQAGPRGSGKWFSFALVLVVLATLAMTAMLRQKTTVPIPAPPIVVAGWLNGPGPTADELRGKVIVLDAWAYWCGPCRASAPELVKLYERYRDQGVVFLGLTAGGEDVDDRNRDFLNDTNITWPNGYGATDTLVALDNESIPERWVIDRNNNIIWFETSNEPIEAAIDRALAQ